MTLAKRTPKGQYHAEDLLGLNQRAETRKKAYEKRNKASKRRSRIIWIGIVAASFYLVPLWIGNSVWLLILGIIFGRSQYYGSWLQRA